jgi:hypothetical protein
MTTRKTKASPTVALTLGEALLNCSGQAKRTTSFKRHKELISRPEKSEH